MEYSEEYMHDYLLGKLGPEEAEQLEQAIESDPELAEALEFQKDVMIGIKAGFDDQLRQKLLKIDTPDSGRMRSDTLRILWQWGSAAAIILGSLGVYFYMNQTNREERIFLAYFEDFPNIVEPVQRDVTGQTEAFRAYQQHLYDEAFAAFSNQENEEPGSIYPAFYKGICALHLEAWPVAIEAFEKVRSNGDPRFEEAATWYVALAYLRDGNRDRATLIFKTIAEKAGNFQLDAVAVLDQLH